MFNVNGKNIYLTRGDTLKITVSIFDSKGNTYTPEPTDIIRFAMKHTYEDDEYTIVKIINNNTRLLELTSEETSNLLFGRYVYDIQLQKLDGEIDTFIPNGVLYLTTEVE